MTTLELDAVVLGAGVAGLYQLHQLREQGLRVRAFDAAGDVGGSWWWNSYPGARPDSEGYIYQYLFDEQLYKEWSWSRKFPGQPEVAEWIRYVADRLRLRGDIQLDTRITAAHYDEDRGRWTVRTDRGDVVDTQFFISCAGVLSAPLRTIEGIDDFGGELVFTASYPVGLDLTGRRVGVVGVGATGVQVISTVAGQAGHLTVFARTPQYVLPMENPSYGPAEQEWYKSRFSELREMLPRTFSGFEYDVEHVWAECTPARRRELLEEMYRSGTLRLWLAGFDGTFSDPEVNEAISEFVRDKMRERLRGDRHLIDTLVPTDYGFGTHRVPLESGYLEAYHRDDVDLVNVRDNPIARIRPEGVELADGTVHELDVIILATGFDAGTGPLTRIDIRGRDGRSLAEEWARDIRTTMGLAKHGYPNLLTTAAPMAPSVALCNMPTCLQQQTEWISAAIRDLRAAGGTTLEPTAEGEEAWVAHHEELAGATLVPTTSSWYMGSNVPGKPRRLLPYIGGLDAYRRRCDDEAAAGYPAFTRT